MLEICTCHYNEDLTWLENCGYPVNIIHKEGGTPIDNPTFTIPNIGAEASAYLKFIIERYDTLPDHTVFLHGHETSYHQCGDRPMLDMIKTANIEKYNFIHLNNSWRCCSLFTQLQMFIEKLKSLQIFLSRDKFITCCGAQFIVSRSCIQQHTKEYYENLFKNIITQNEAVMMEHMWHFIFTGKDSVFPHDDDFNPPIKEILYSTASFCPLSIKDVKLCYVGNQKPIISTDYIHINSKELYDYYNIRGVLFFCFTDDFIPFKVDDTKIFKFLYNNQLHDFLQHYKNSVKMFEDVIQMLD